jgi:5-methylcytosine-specific restriction endonuclease McrA
MSTAPSRPCKRPRCGGFAAPGSKYCAAHQPLEKAETTARREQLDAQRGTAHARGYDSKWAALSRQMRQKFPVSHGYLTRTEYWTHNLAQQFNTLRMHAAEAGQFVAFMAKDGPGPRFLDQFPIYDFHRSDGAEPGQVTDHIIPHRGDPLLMWAEWNLQVLSKRQHDTKTATEDGGFRGAGTPHASQPSTHGIL